MVLICKCIAVRSSDKARGRRHGRPRKDISNYDFLEATNIRQHAEFRAGADAYVVPLFRASAAARSRICKGRLT